MAIKFLLLSYSTALLYLLPFHCHIHVLSKLHPHRCFIIYCIVRRFFSFSFTSVIWSRMLSELYGIVPATNCTTVSLGRLHWHSLLLAVPFIVSRNIEAVVHINPASAGIFSVSCCVQEHNRETHLFEAVQLNQSLCISFTHRFFFRRFCQLSWQVSRHYHGTSRDIKTYGMKLLKENP